MKAAIAATAASIASEAAMPQTAAPKGTTVAPGPLPWMKGLEGGELPAVRTSSADEVANSTRNFFTVKQRATLERLCDTLMPPSKGRPGATQADVPAFLDLFVGKSLPDVQQTYLHGLDWLDSESITTEKKSFADLNDNQVDAILKPRLVAYMHDHLPADPDKRFVAMAHEDIRMATRNSPAWGAAVAQTGRPPGPGEIYWHQVEPVLNRVVPAGQRIR